MSGSTKMAPFIAIGQLQNSVLTRVFGSEDLTYQALYRFLSIVPLTPLVSSPGDSRSEHIAWFKCPSFSAIRLSLLISAALIAVFKLVP